ncbi:PLAC8-domain-containing protein [Gonapodya prolifera JEL478]|uniref:PLAC8-domain-containing protein n=1 Tax=Gonapodya prolifera (strain JEL478) TaxID=1344416 RepID=A0A138ZZJ8_GONPJ|nr:PLAC8-domain-containing protein [Gonapodya prolifera JEL478]|eukprot:KXS09920.1 PLAC8-domain-containing protein [Gonapodya prolifera JEL478]
MLHLPHRQAQARSWDKPLFDVVDDLETFIISWFVPCIPHGKISEAEGLGDCVTQGAIYGALSVCCGLSCIVGMQRREAVRRARNIPGDQVEDLVSVCCCPCFALTQETNEIKKYPAVKAYAPQPAPIQMAPPTSH